MTRQKETIVSGYVRTIRAGDYLERTTTNKKPVGGTSIEWLYDTYFEENEETGELVERVSRTGEYLVKSTGEILRIKEQAQQRLENFRQIRIACNRFKWKLRANAKNAKLFITLTYAENMTDTKRLYEDFRRFWQKYKRISGNSDCRYMVAFEPQERGAWHAHLITFGGLSYVSAEQIGRIWGHGFVKVQSCRNIADLGGYLTSYLTNLTPCADDSEELKASKKGARLCFYPARFRFLRWSKGLEDPIEETSEMKQPAELDTEEFEKIKDVTIKTIVPEIMTPIFTRHILYVKKSRLKWIQRQRNKSKRKFYKKNNKNP